ncbi:hypothetical protein V1527DRAFT_476142 [Lipomyces starkeyi]
MAIGSRIELSDSGDADTRPSAYAQELASFQLSLCENPEVKEDNDEESLRLLRILHWATGDQYPVKRLWGLQEQCRAIPCEKHRNHTITCGLIMITRRKINHIEFGNNTSIQLFETIAPLRDLLCFFFRPSRLPCEW